MSKWEDTVMKNDSIKEYILGDKVWELVKEYLERQAEISFKAGIKYVLSSAVTYGCLSTVNKKHGIHIPDKLYEELSDEAK